MSPRQVSPQMGRKIAAAVRGAIKGGLKPGTFEVRTENGEVRILPCVPVEVHSGENPWDEVLPGAA